MFKFIKRRKTQQLTNRAIINWLEDLDSILIVIEHDLAELRADLEDLTDFVESELD